jgi:hypothetical protein
MRGHILKIFFNEPKLNLIVHIKRMVATALLALPPHSRRFNLKH